ncbi:manganese catalase family protein [Anaerosporobacter sp.]|uniref:manganese catalase family protein n=1 Tax=Anaerosporobacter sp. TaxID=1872529 RepID=UPI00286EBBDE|nr:manganese catalase family protein [Anaerosporobacter sp.]
MEVISAILYQLTRGLPAEESSNILSKIDCCTPEFEFSSYNMKEKVLMFLHENMVAEQKAKLLYDTILTNVHDTAVSDPIRFLRAREIVHYQRFGEAIQLVQEKIEKE